MKKCVVHSNYFKKIETVLYNHELAKSRSIIWGNEIHNTINSHNLVITGNTEIEVMQLFTDNLMKSDILQYILTEIDRHIICVNNIHIDVSFQYTLDYSKRYLKDDYKITHYEDKKIVIIAFKYYKNNEVLMTNAHSDDIKGFCIKEFIKYLKNNYLKLLDLFLLKKKELIHFNYIVFPPYLASIIAHELFGHLFEIDNFNNLKNERNNIIIPKFVTVIDSPLSMLSGYCSFDDYGNILSTTVIVKDGVIQNLITDIDGKLSTRIRAGETKCIPRLTNTIINVSSEGLVSVNDFLGESLLIESIIQSKLSNNNIIVYADACYIKNQGEKYRTSPMSFSINAVTILHSIVGFYGKASWSSSIDCIKKHQSCGGVGFSSPGMILKINNTKNN